MNKYPKTTEQFDRDLLREIGARIRTKRKEKRISALALAAKLEISKETLYRIERGEENMKVRDLYWISRGLSVSVDFLLFGETAAMNDYLEPDGIFSRLDYRETKRMEAIAEITYPEKAEKAIGLQWIVTHKLI